MVEMLEITKRFGAVTALDRVDLTISPNSIHALVGENGAGKTTLMRALYGASQPDEGMIRLAGQQVSFHSSSEAIANGIGMVSQHYGIIPELTCIQNLILGAEGGAVIDLKASQQRAQALAQTMGFEFDWGMDAGKLSPAGAQKLEILKLLWRNTKVMILDEPTAMLSPTDSDALFESLKQLAGNGAAVILVTHRLPEVLQHCETVTVLRAGKLVASKPVAETTSEELSNLIVGTVQAPVPAHRSAQTRALDDAILEIVNLVPKPRDGAVQLKGVDLRVSAGELLGIAGVDGSGQTELFQSILGLSALEQGNIALDGQSIKGLSTAERITLGVRVIPEDRLTEAVIEDWSLEMNSALGLQRQPLLGRNGFIDTTARTNWAKRVTDRFNTKHGGLKQKMSSLSGGNQQRFVAGRVIESNPKLILAFQPVRGLDIKGTAEVYQALRDECANGAAAVVVSFDLDELLENCDRVVAMSGGKLHEPEEGKSLDREAIGRLMVGAK